MKLETHIREKIEAALHPTSLEVQNESHQHSVALDSETHFKLTVVSKAFEGLPLVTRHQKIYAMLEQEFKEGLHALALHAYTPDEWKEKAGSKDSPPCLGGSKK